MSGRRHYFVTVAEVDTIGGVEETSFVVVGLHPAEWLARRRKWLRACGHDVHAFLRFYRPIPAEVFRETESELVPPKIVMPN